MHFQASITKNVVFIASEGPKMVKSEKKYLKIATVRRYMCSKKFMKNSFFPGRIYISYFGKNAIYTQIITY